MLHWLVEAGTTHAPLEPPGIWPLVQGLTKEQAVVLEVDMVHDDEAGVGHDQEEDARAKGCRQAPAIHHAN